MKKKIIIRQGDISIASIYENHSKTPKGTAILMHGRRSSKDSKTYIHINKIFLAHGFQTIRFDFRGHGESSGAPNWQDYGVLDQLEDVRIVISFLEKNDLLSKPLILLASSFAAESALLYSAEDKEVKQIILVSPGMGKNSSGTKNNFYRKEWWDNNIQTTQINFESYKQKLNKIKSPVHVLHGIDDESIPLSMSQELIKLIPNAELYRIEGGKHNFKENKNAMHKRIKIIHEILKTMTAQRS